MYFPHAPCISTYMTWPLLGRIKHFWLIVQRSVWVCKSRLMKSLRSFKPPYPCVFICIYRNQQGDNNMGGYPKSRGLKPQNIAHFHYWAKSHMFDHVWLFQDKSLVCRFKLCFLMSHPVSNGYRPQVLNFDHGPYCSLWLRISRESLGDLSGISRESAESSYFLRRVVRPRIGRERYGGLRGYN